MNSKLFGICLLLCAGLAQAASSCTAITPANISVTLGSPSPLLTATCSSPNPVGYKWTVNNVLLATCTASTCSIPAAMLIASTNYTVSVTNTESAATATIKVTGTPTITIPKSCTHSPGGIFRVFANSGGAMAFPSSSSDGGQTTGIDLIYTLKTGVADSILHRMDIIYYATNLMPVRTVSISKSPCDWNSADVVSKASGVTTAFQFYIATAPNPLKPNIKYLLPNSTYFINIKAEAPTAPGVDTCTGDCTIRAKVMY